MKNIKIKVVAVMMIAAMAFTGCMNVNMDVVINSDGSGVATAVVSVDKQMYIDAMVKLMKESGMPVSEAEIEKELDTNMAQQGLKPVTVDGREYYQTTQKETIQKGGLQKEFGDESFASYVTTDTFYMEFAMSEMDEMNTFNETGAMFGKDSLDAVKVTMTVQFPKAIVSTNGTVDKANPNKVSFNLPIDRKAVLFATTKAGVTQNSVKAEIKKLNAIKAPKIKKLKANAVKEKAKKASVTLKFGKVKTAKNYQVQCSTKKNFKGAKTKTIKKTTYTIKKLKKGKKYYVRVRAAKVNYAGVEVYSKWTKKTVKTKNAKK